MNNEKKESEEAANENQHEESQGHASQLPLLIENVLAVLFLFLWDVQFKCRNALHTFAKVAWYVVVKVALPLILLCQ